MRKAFKKHTNRRVSGLPLNAKLVAEMTTSDGTKSTLHTTPDGAVYAQRLEKVTYLILGGK